MCIQFVCKPTAEIFIYTSTCTMYMYMYILYLCIAKRSAKAATVFSPPDKLSMGRNLNE